MVRSERGGKEVGRKTENERGEKSNGGKGS